MNRLIEEKSQQLWFSFSPLARKGGRNPRGSFPPQFCPFCLVCHSQSGDYCCLGTMRLLSMSRSCHTRMHRDIAAFLVDQKEPGVIQANYPHLWSLSASQVDLLSTEKEEQPLGHWDMWEAVEAWDDKQSSVMEIFRAGGWEEAGCTVKMHLGPSFGLSLVPPELSRWLPEYNQVQ